MITVEDYSDLHQATLQTLMGHGTIETKEFEKIFQQMWHEFLPNTEMNTSAITEVIDMINEKISPFDQKIAKFDYELANKEFIVFFSSAQTSISKLQNFYNEAELDFFKLILTKITDNEELSIAPRDALNLTTHITGKLNKLRAQKLLDSWITTCYFYQHSDNQIYLGARMLAEFKELLQKLELPYCRTCLLCENIAIWGESCKSCETIFHQKCIRKFLSRQKNQKCPSCKEKWETPANENGDEETIDESS